MDWNAIEGNWRQMKGKAKEQWGKLTDDQLDVIAGKREQLGGKIQALYGFTKERTEVELDHWAKRNQPYNQELPHKS